MTKLIEGGRPQAWVPQERQILFMQELPTSRLYQPRHLTCTRLGSQQGHHRRSCLTHHATKQALGSEVPSCGPPCAPTAWVLCPHITCTQAMPHSCDPGSAHHAAKQPHRGVRQAICAAPLCSIALPPRLTNTNRTAAAWLPKTPSVLLNCNQTPLLGYQQQVPARISSRPKTCHPHLHPDHAPQL